MKQRLTLTESQLHRIIKESVKSILAEARGLQSNKLYDILQQHGGFKYNKGIGDRHALKDEDIIGVVKYSDRNNRELLSQMASQNNIIISRKNADDIMCEELKDGTYLVYVLRAADFDRRYPQPEGAFKSYIEKTSKREHNKPNDRYQYINPHAERGIVNPWFRDGNKYWPKEDKQWLVNQARAELEKNRQRRRQ